MNLKIPLATQCKAVGLPKPETEFRFHPKRLWRFDLAFVEMRLAVEIEGGVFARKGAKRCGTCGVIPSGRHSSGKGMLADMVKYNSATLLGWRIIRVTPQQVERGEALTIIEGAFKELQKPLVGIPIQPGLDFQRSTPTEKETIDGKSQSIQSGRRTTRDGDAKTRGCDKSGNPRRNRP